MSGMFAPVRGVGVQRRCGRVLGVRLDDPGGPHAQRAGQAAVRGGVAADELQRRGPAVRRPVVSAKVTVGQAHFSGGIVGSLPRILYRWTSAWSLMRSPAP